VIIRGRTGTPWRRSWRSATARTRRNPGTTPWLLEQANSPVAVLAPLIRALSYGEHPTTGAVTGFSQQMIAATPPRTVLNFLPTLSTHDELAALSALRQCPVVCVAGQSTG